MLYSYLTKVMTFWSTIFLNDNLEVKKVNALYIFSLNRFVM